jgi:hypothetical protein
VEGLAHGRSAGDSRCASRTAAAHGARPVCRACRREGRCGRRPGERPKRARRCRLRHLSPETQLSYLPISDIMSSQVRLFRPMNHGTVPTRPHPPYRVYLGDFDIPRRRRPRVRRHRHFRMGEAKGPRLGAASVRPVGSIAAYNFKPAPAGYPLGCVGGSVANLVLDLLRWTRDQFAALGGHGYGRSTTASSSSNHSGSPRLRPAAMAVAVSFHEVSSASTR